MRDTVELTKKHYETLAAWRHALRRFLHFSQEAARAAGIPPQQHQALLAIKGFPERDHTTIGELAERLHLKHHSAVGLVNRLVERQTSPPAGTDIGGDIPGGQAPRAAIDVAKLSPVQQIALGLRDAKPVGPVPPTDDAPPHGAD